MKTCTKCGVEKPLDSFYRHPHAKHGRNPTCKDCHREYCRKRYESKREQICAQRREYNARRQAEDPSYYRGRSIRNRYGITVDEYEKLLRAQNNRCAVCERQLDDSHRPHLDHCHVTGKIRGFLCQWCNTGLGMLNDSPERIRKLADYAEQHAGLV